MTATVIALGILLALVLMIWGAVNAAKRDSADATRKDAQIKDMENAAKIHKAAAAARSGPKPDTAVDQRLRDIGKLRD